jgi:hypothetical protein
VNAHAPCEDKNNGIKNSFSEELGHTFYQLHMYNIKIFFCDFIAKVGREDMFRQTVSQEQEFMQN